MHFQPRMNTDEHRYKKKPKIRFLSAFICVHLWLLSCLFSVTAHAQETITVAVASSLYPTLQQQTEAFEKEHHVTIRLVPGSTGRLYNQIMQGAPFDLFIAADSDRPALLAKQGRVIEQYRLGQGYVGLLAGKKVLEDMDALTSSSIRHIVIANPNVAPFGKASKEALIEHGLWTLLKPKFVYAQNAMQAAMMVDKGLVDAGFIPVAFKHGAVAEINYMGVLLQDKPMAIAWLKSIVFPATELLVLRKP